MGVFECKTYMGQHMRAQASSMRAREYRVRGALCSSVASYSISNSVLFEHHMI